MFQPSKINPHVGSSLNNTENWTLGLPTVERPRTLTHALEHWSHWSFSRHEQARIAPRSQESPSPQASRVRLRRPTVSRSHPKSPGAGCAARCHSARLISGGSSAGAAGSGSIRFRLLLRSLAGALAGDLAGVLAGDLVGDSDCAAARLAGVPALAFAGDALGVLAGDALGALAGEAFGVLAGDAFGVLAPPDFLGEAALRLEGVVDGGSGELPVSLTVTRSSDRSCHFTSPSVYATRCTRLPRTHVAPSLVCYVWFGMEGAGVGV